MKRFGTALLGLIILAGCIGCGGSTIVREEAAYRTEVKWNETAGTRLAAHLEGFVKAHCTCDQQLNFTTKECEKAAKDALVVKARLPWHSAMMMYNGGLLDERPPEEAPKWDDPSTLCPGASPPATPEGGE